MNIKENKNWLITTLIIFIAYWGSIFILCYGSLESIANLVIYGVVLVVVGPLFALLVWGLIKIKKSKHLKANKNWLIIPVFLFTISLILYVITIFGAFGLIFWEIAYIMIVPCILVIIWCRIRLTRMKKGRIGTYKRGFLVFSIITCIGFSIFALIPSISVFSLGPQFEAKFKAELGDDYWDKIPKKYREKLKSPENYFDTKDLSYFWNRDIEIETIEYGNDEYQIIDKYDDSTNKDDNKPAFIYIHGGGSMKQPPGGTGKLACTYFATLGFVSFSIEYTPAPVEPFPKGVADVMKAIVFIKNHYDEYNIDNESIVLFGGSRGGHLVTQVAYVGVNNDDWWREHGANYTQEELEVACVVDLYGAVDQVYEYEHAGFLNTRNNIIFGGSYEEKTKVWEKHTVKNYISKDVPPTLVFHGTLDGMVMIGESREFVKELENEGADYIYLEYPFGQHGFDVVPGTAGNFLTYYFVPRYILSVLYS